MTKNSNYGLIDILKFAMCLIVIGIHSHPFISYDAKFDQFFFSTFGSLAVPFFFITSGFFLYKNYSGFESTKKFILRIVKLYAFWFILNLPFTLANCYYNGMLNFKVGALVFLRDCLTLSSFRGAWFLGALVVGSLLIHYLNIYKKINIKILVLAFFLLTIFIGVLNGYLNIISFQNYWFSFFLEPSRLIRGIPYMLIGKMIIEKKFENKLVNRKHLILALLFCLFLMPIETIVLKGCYITQFITTVVFFLLILTFKVNFGNTTKIRKMSIIFYCFHFNVCFLFDGLNYFTKISIDSLTKYAIILFISYIISQIIFKLEKIDKLKILKNSY